LRKQTALSCAKIFIDPHRENYDSRCGSAKRLLSSNTSAAGSTCER
jgi:hypothetical protein